MKRIFTLLLTLLLCGSLFGCAVSSPPDTTGSTALQAAVTNSEATKATEATETAKATQNTKATEATIATEATEIIGATDSAVNNAPTQTVHTHNWMEATCSSPKTCATCGATSGLAAGHSFADGKCTSCGKGDPDYRQETMVWIPTKGGKKYHSNKSCSGMENPDYVTKSQAESSGFTPCKKCYK